MHTGSIATILAPGVAAVEQVPRETRATSTTVYDPNIRPRLIGDPKDACEIVEHLMGLSDLIKCFGEDIVWLYGRDAGLETVLRSWLDKGVTVVVITRGKEGALALSISGVRLEVPADPSVVVADTVGAGDFFMGGLEDTLWSEDLAGADRREVLRAADAEALEWIIRHTAAIADITVLRTGANLPTRDEPP